MHLTHSAATVALLSAMAMAGPIEERAAKSKGKTFTLKQVKSNKGHPGGPMVEVLKVYKKYGVSRPQVASKATVKSSNKAAGTTGSVAANPQSYDISYLCPITIGGQAFNVNFDTGSSDLWVMSGWQPQSQINAHPTVYRPRNSKTSVNVTGQSWDLTYGDGSGAKGLVVADTVVVGPVTATRQAVEVATSASADMLSDKDQDGILGLGFAGNNAVYPKQQTTFFDTVKGGLAAKLFTANLEKGAPGTYDFGFVNASKYTGAITYTPVVPDSDGGYYYWQINTGGFQVGSKARNTASMGKSIVDTGSSLLYLPDTPVNQYYASVSGAKYVSASNVQGWTFPCKTALPSFSIVLGGTLYTIPGNYLNYMPTDNTGTTCFGGLQSSAGFPFNVLGDIFLKSVFAIFDQTQSTPRMGFAKQTSLSTK